MEIGLFQLENLATTPSQYVFFDLRDERTPIHPEIDRVLIRSELSKPANVLPRLRELSVPPSIPVVLMSEDGVVALQLFATLEREGFEQVYVVDGGILGLLTELERD